MLFTECPSIYWQTDVNFLTKYLRLRDWDVKKAFDVIKRIYKIKVIIKKYTKNYNKKTSHINVPTKVITTLIASIN